MATADARSPLRIWLSAPLLFDRGEDGAELLTDAGKARVDSAMATFLQFSREDVLMVEGYAAGRSKDEEYLRSQARAALVRDYLVTKFGLKPQYVGLMPLGTAAPGSPTRGTWEGIGLALFVDPLQLAGLAGD
jgi:hypothetical protein